MAYAFALVEACKRRRAQQFELLQVGPPDATTAIEQRQQHIGAAVECHAAARDGAADQAGGRAGHVQAQVGGQRRDGRTLDVLHARGCRIDDVNAVAIGVERRGEARAGGVDRAQDVLNRGGTRQIDGDDGAIRETQLEVVGGEKDASTTVQGRECRAGRQCVETAGVEDVRAGPADKPCPFDARQRIDFQADRQLAVGDGEIGVPRFVQGVSAQAAVDRVGPAAAGDHVVAGAALQRVRQGIADDRVVKGRAGDAAEAGQFGKVGRQAAGEVHDHRFRSRREVDRVDAGATLQDLDTVEGQAVNAADHDEAGVGQLGHGNVCRHGREDDPVDALAVVATRSLDDRLHAPAIGQHVGVAADVAGEHVVAGAAGERVVEFVACDLVLARTGLCVLERIHRRQRDAQAAADRLCVDPGEAQFHVRGAGREVQRVDAARRFVEEEVASLAGVENVGVVAGVADQDHGTRQCRRLDVEGVGADAAGEGGLFDAYERVAGRPENQTSRQQREIDIR